ncbi:PLC-like phosphodiesterase [Apodospora peruviana]|uniref:PLC-like phosphodiesterase n=1 Tax=Apodospora peruviana TaxID=516989 RepID=A0AAE0IIF3_9PEZI|nr:PLC-like phosphodiesterase [Apodospora peruviana]
MMMVSLPRRLLWALTSGVIVVLAQLPSDPTDGLTVLTGTKTGVTEHATPTGPYLSVTSTLTLATTSLSSGGTLGSSIAPNATDGFFSTLPTTTGTVTFLTGSASSKTTTGTDNATTTIDTTTAPIPTNTRPCNNYPEFCNRKYSNITEVGCHNSPFVRAGSAAANQQFPVTDQLNDGVRFLQAQMQWPANATAAGSPPHFCHTSCDLLDAGPITDWLTSVKDWVAAHPYDVVTILLGNGNYSTPDHYVPFIESTGILQYIYTPPIAPLARDDWPTLAQMILSGQRVIMFMDYMANQTAYPWLMDQFSQMWETPFDPLDQKFPCTVQRPPDLSPEDAKKRLYLMNHNLNVEVALLGTTILVPAVSELNVTNNATGFGSVGLAANNCRSDWDYPPKILNVDYYNYGGYPGSVFEAAARVNNVSYGRPCCGAAANAAGGRIDLVGVRVLVNMGLIWTAVWCLS